MEPEEEEVEGVKEEEGVEEEGVEEEGIEPKEGDAQDLEEDEAEEAEEAPAAEPQSPQEAAETTPAPEEPTAAPAAPEKPAPAPVDPIQAAIERRARDLSLSGIIRPETLARKLRESIVEIVGPEASVAYHIGAELKDGQIKFQIARLGPHLLARLTADMDSAELEMAYQKTTAGGWRIGVGLTASTSLEAPIGSELTASFSVTISR